MESRAPLVCRCACGEASWFHDDCLVDWVRNSGSLQCEICGQAYRGLTRELRVVRVSPSVAYALMVDGTSSMIFVVGAWWRGYCGALGAFVLTWWGIMWSLDRALRANRRAADVVTFRMDGLRVMPPS